MNINPIKLYKYQKVYKTIKNSGLFDSKYYLFTYPDVRAQDIDPIKHYILNGAKEGRNPSAHFDTNYYLSTYKDMDVNKINPLFHYIVFGWKENRNPSSSFDTKFYLDTYKDVKKSGMNPLLHFVKYGAKEGRRSGLCPTTIETFICKRILERTRNYWNYKNEDIFIKKIELEIEEFINKNNKYEAPLISIVMPTHNRENSIPMAIESVLKQTYNNFELIIVDDCSTDNTESIVKNYQINDKRVKYYKIEKGGVSKARNKALTEAKGEYVFFLDSDNQWRQDFLFIMIHYMMMKNLDAAYSAIAMTSDFEKFERFIGTEYEFASLLDRNFIDMNAFGFRRKNKDVFFDESLKRLVDWDFILSVVYMNKVEYIPFIGVYYYNGYNGNRITHVESLKNNHNKSLVDIIQKKHIEKNLNVINYNKDDFAVAIIVNVYDLNILPDIFMKLQNVKVKYDLYIITTNNNTNVVKEFISNFSLNAKIFNFKNVNVDTFLYMLPTLQQYSLVLKLDAKINIAKFDFNIWENYTIDSLLYSEKDIIEIIDKFKTDKRIMIAGPKNNFLNDSSIYKSINDNCKKIYEIFSQEKLIDGWGFFKGSMFWFRPSVFKIIEYIYKDNKYKELINDSNKIEDIFERLYGCIATNVNKSNVMLLSFFENNFDDESIKILDINNLYLKKELDSYFFKKLSRGDIIKNFNYSHFNNQNYKNIEEIVSANVIKHFSLPWYIKKNTIKNKVSIIIPTFNNLKFTRDCINSIYTKTTYKNFEVIIVNNGSDEETSVWFNENLNKYNNLKYIKNIKNYGFSVGNNIGYMNSDGEYVLFLNNDTAIVTNNWLELFIESYERNDNIEILSPKLVYPDNTIQCAGIVFNSVNCMPYHIYQNFDEKDPLVNKERVYNASTGACMFMSSKLYRLVRGFSPYFLNGGEDIDLCFKIFEYSKNRVKYIPNIKIIHYESKAEGRFLAIEYNREILYNKWLKTLQLRDDQKYYSTDNMFVKKYLKNKNDKNNKTAVYKPDFFKLPFIVSDIKSVIIFKPSGIGNMVMFTPTLIALKEIFFNAKITIACFDAESNIVRDYVDNIIILSKNNETGEIYSDEIQKLIQHDKYDVAIYPQFTNFGRPTEYLNKTIPYHLFFENIDYTVKHEVLHNFDIAYMLGWKKNIPEMCVPVDETFQIGEDISEMVVVHIGASEAIHMQKKKWPQDRWIELFNIYLKNEKIVFIGGNNESADINYIVDNISNSIIRFDGKLNLKQTAKVIKECKYVISTDSGLMHMAAALKKPIVAIFGPTLLSKNSVWGNHIGIEHVISFVDCAPCYSEPKKLFECKNPICMYEISSFDVYRAVNKIKSNLF